MKKVCHMTSVHNRYDGRIFENECVALAENGYETYLVVEDNGKDEILDGVHFIATNHVPHNRIERMTISSQKVLKKALEVNADIYHIHDPELMICGLKLKRKGKKVIFDAHENVVCSIESKEYIPTFLRKCIKHIYKKIEKNCCSKFDAIISVDPIICDNFKKINENVVMVTNYPRLELGNIENCKVTSTICFAGGIDSQWNHLNILNAIKEIPEVKYVLCGFENTEYMQKLQQNEGWKQVIYKGKVSHKEALSVMKHSGVIMALCAYSGNTNGKYGTLGNTKLFEAMMMGRPVICTDSELWKEIIDKYNCGLYVNPNDVEAIKTAINELLSNIELNIKMGNNGKEAVKKEFNWSREEEKLLKLYAEI